MLKLDDFDEVGECEMLFELLCDCWMLIFVVCVVLFYLLNVVMLNFVVGEVMVGMGENV